MVGQAGTLWVRLSNFSWIPVAAGFRNHARINSQRHGTRQARVPAPRRQVAKCEVILAWSLSRPAKGAQHARDGAREAILVDRLRERNRKRLPSGVLIVRYQARQALSDGLFR